VPLAEQGCQVTVIEPSPDALATLRRRATDAGVAGLVTARQGDIEALASAVADGEAELVLAHGLLEVVDDPAAALAALRVATAPGGAVSVVVANKYAAVLHRVIAGRFADANRLLADPDGVPSGAEDTLLRRFDAEGLRSALTSAGLDVDLLQGHRVLSDLAPGGVLDDPASAEALAQLENRAAARSPLRDIASQLHAIGRRR
jgi:SAM-dependent methyltransferase